MDGLVMLHYRLPCHKTLLLKQVHKYFLSFLQIICLAFIFAIIFRKSNFKKGKITDARVQEEPIDLAKTIPFIPPENENEGEYLQVNYIPQIFLLLLLLP